MAMNKRGPGGKSGGGGGRGHRPGAVDHSVLTAYELRGGKVSASARKAAPMRRPVPSRPTEVWADIEPRMALALEGKPQHFETWRRTVDGQPVFVSASYLPDMAADGSVRGLFIQIIDITERKRVEERVSHLNEELELRIQERSAELLESEQRFRLMVDNLRDYCIFFMDAEGTITDWTDSAQRMNGYNPVQMMGRHYGLLLNPNDPDAGIESSEGVTVITMPRHVSYLQAAVVYTLPLQLLSYHVAILRGTDVDQPRNLAKSVTVE